MVDSRDSDRSNGDVIVDDSNSVDGHPIQDVFDFYQNCSADLIRAQIDILVTDPIRNLKEKLRDIYIPVLDDYEIWLAKGKVSNERDSLFELSDVPYQYAKLKLEISHSLRRLTIAGFRDITSEKRAFNSNVHTKSDLAAEQLCSPPPFFPQFLNEPNAKTELDLLISRLPVTIPNCSGKRIQIGFYLLKHLFEQNRTSDECKLWTKICIKWFSLKKAKMRFLQISGTELLDEDPARFLSERLECQTKSDRFIRYFERMRATREFSRDDLIACKKTQQRTYDNYKPPPVLKDFLRALLARFGQSEDSNADTAIIKWTDEKNGQFQVINTKEIARLWSAEKQREITSSSLLQSLTFYCDNGVLIKISTKPRIFKFV